MEGGPAIDQFAAKRIREQTPYPPAEKAATVERLPAIGRNRNVIPLKPAHLAGLHRRSFYERRGKRMFDVTFSLAFLVLAGSWLFPLLALAIRLDSRGPVFFRQKRVGLNGGVFTCLKFRTMVHRPDEGFVQCQKNDTRITRMGSFLRRTNLDELPQFLNVLRGEMSVIGPRPHVPELDAVFKDIVPMYVLRNAVKPGVSGLAQVSGCRGETRSAREMNNRVRFDVFYCRNISFYMDLKLVGLTILRALQGDERAY